MNSATTDGKPATPRLGAWACIPCRTDVHVRLTTGLEARSTRSVSARLRALGGVLLLGCSLASSFAESSFTGLGFLPGGTNSVANAVSSDGSVVVGNSESVWGAKAFHWTKVGGMVALGALQSGTNSSHATGVSSNGSVVVGYSLTSSGLEAFRWTAASGMVALGGLPGGQKESSAFAISSDGKVVVGVSGSLASGSVQAFRWTAAGGMVGLGTLPGGSNSHSSAVSSNGSVVVGTSESALGYQAFRWTAAGGMISLGYLADWGTNGTARGVSSDGSVVVGCAVSASGNQAFRWTAVDGMVGLGHLPSGNYNLARAISSDGSALVGYEYGAANSPEKAFIWDNVNGMRNLHSVLTSDYKLDLTGWTLSMASGMSADGTTIVGNGTHNGRIEAWVAHLDRPVNAPAGKGRGK
ncbi:MAG: PEP-CTERM sorting domain-containing protein [Verrucomicrobia bacterium]|nr:PEP-CTERM sorting domain-containing protein [Verrucomicrobiota bacterium]